MPSHNSSQLSRRYHNRLASPDLYSPCLSIPQHTRTALPEPDPTVPQPPKLTSPSRSLSQLSTSQPPLHDCP